MTATVSFSHDLGGATVQIHAEWQDAEPSCGIVGGWFVDFITWTDGAEWDRAECERELGLEAVDRLDRAAADAALAEQEEGESLRSKW